MADLTQRIKWLNNQLKKDKKELNDHKLGLLDGIKQIDKKTLINPRREMPQFSEEYLEEKYNEKKPLLEGYLSHFLRVSEFIDEFPFATSGDTIVEIIIPEPAFLKILREIEEVNSPEGVVVHLSDIPQEYEVKIGNTFFKFKKS